MTRARLAYAFLLVVIVSAGCRSTASAPNSTAAQPTPSDIFFVQVQNDNPQDFDIYFERAGTSLRLGLVTGRTAVFQVDRTHFSGRGQLRLIARSIVGSQEFESQPVLVELGESVVFRLSEQLALSRVTVRR